MSYSVRLSSRYKKSFKKMSSREQEEIDSVVEMLSNDIPLLPKHYDHALQGEYKGFRECHIKADLLLIYRKNKEVLELYLLDIGSHSDLFE